MPNFDAESLLRWFHFVSLVIAGGSMPVCLLLSGFEDTHEDIRGLSAVVLKKMTIWGLRCAVALGLLLFVTSMAVGNRPFEKPHLMFVLGISTILLVLCEISPKPLAVGKRSFALLTMVLFLVVSFIASNGHAFFSDALF